MDMLPFVTRTVVRRKTARFNFTKKVLDSLSCVGNGKQSYFYDTQVKGLGFSVARGGSKSFVYCRKLNGTTKKKFIGYYPETTIEQARVKASALSVQVATGVDPFEARESKQAELAFGKLFDFYMEKFARPHTKRPDNAQSSFNLQFQKWVNRKVSTIKRIEVQNWIDELALKKGKYCANRCHDLMRAVINWGIKKEYLQPPNPCIGVDRYKVKSRERFVQPGDEFERLAKAINEEPDDTIRDFFWMCIYTGARKSNVLAMRWEFIDFVLHTWKIPETKNGETQYVSLTQDALELLSRRKENAIGQWVFPSERRADKHFGHPKFAWERILKRANITDLRIHDLRRTLGSYMAIMGISPTIIGKALGHKSLQSTAVYARLTQSPVREAMEKALSAVPKLRVADEPFGEEL